MLIQIEQGEIGWPTDLDRAAVAIVDTGDAGRIGREQFDELLDVGIKFGVGDRKRSSALKKRSRSSSSVPSSSPTLIAATSAGVRSGGLTLNTVSNEATAE